MLKLPPLGERLFLAMLLRCGLGMIILGLFAFTYESIGLVVALILLDMGITSAEVMHGRE